MLLSHAHWLSCYVANNTYIFIAALSGICVHLYKRHKHYWLQYMEKMLEKVYFCWGNDFLNLRKQDGTDRDILFANGKQG
jgi:hypothetical protein